MGVDLWLPQGEDLVGFTVMSALHWALELPYLRYACEALSQDDLEACWSWSGD